jgi:hypothetical protein
MASNVHFAPPKWINKASITCVQATATNRTFYLAISK